MSDSIIIFYSRDGENYVNGQLTNLERGNCRVIVDYIKEATDADVFEVETKEPYPDSYMETIDIAKKELADKTMPELKEVLSDISDYDTVYIVSPIWWGTIPMALYEQLDKLDFNGKTVKTIITHEGSGLGNCVKDIKSLCKGAEVKDGLPIHGADVNDAKDEVLNWLKY